MFDPVVMLFVTAVFTAIHISVWHILPRKARHMVFAMPVLAFLIDFAGSGLITEFTGVASFVGICNMAASVAFGIYAVICVQYYGIKGLKLNWYKLWIIPFWPKIDVEYCKNGVTKIE